MSQNFFTYLPSEIIIDILSRLPIRTIVFCKCVCTSWLGILRSRDFADFHLSKSVPGLVLYQNDKLVKIFEFKDELDLERHELHYNQITEFESRAFITFGRIGIEGSANGLLFLADLDYQSNDLYICNPITRDYIELPYPPEESSCEYIDDEVLTYGFGVSKLTGQHKVVRIFHECTYDPDTLRLLKIPKSLCQVYTLGTGSWRTVSMGSSFEYKCGSIGAFLDGNLHWLVADLKESFWISCFNLETECFSTFSPPPPPCPQSRRIVVGLVALGDCLCLCDNTSEDEIVIWLMEEYGVEISWTKEFVISKVPDFTYGRCVYPIKVFKDGDVLMFLEGRQNCFLFYYSRKTKTTAEIDMFELYTWGRINSMLHTSSFLSLRNFPEEDVFAF